MSKDKGLIFYEASHRYKLDGEWVPGVTTILGVLDKPAIPKWAATQVAEFVANHPDLTEQMKQLGGVGPTVAFLKNLPWEKRDTAAVRGTDVHNIAERIVQGDQVEVPEHLVGYVESALAFMDDYGIEPVLVEACVGSRKHQYAGKLDLIADSKLGRAIFDYKTTASGIYATTAWQNTAYAFAEFYNTDVIEDVPESPLPTVEASFGVHLRPDGYAVHRLEYSQHIFAEFLHIRAAYEANKRAVGNWRVPGSGYVGVSEQSEASA